ncbi:MAG: hypothetical protein ACFFG0_03655 [Candidatus Thorarchaeota archaeon]
MQESLKTQIFKLEKEIASIEKVYKKKNKELAKLKQLLQDSQQLDMFKDEVKLGY